MTVHVCNACMLIRADRHVERINMLFVMLVKGVFVRLSNAPMMPARLPTSLPDAVATCLHASIRLKDFFLTES